MKTPKDQTAVSRDSGLGASGSGDGIGAGTKVSAVAGNPGINLSAGLPLPTQLPSMDFLERLADNLYGYSGELFRGLEETSMAMLDKVLSGFKKSGSHAREYIFETAAITINFFSTAGDMEAELESSEALKLWEAVNGMKESIHGPDKANCFGGGDLTKTRQQTSTTSWHQFWTSSKSSWSYKARSNTRRI